ncbi:MAG TPA: hypothetical protein VD978_11180 [Azospirillum sp.]|nr:hypothetical protein [Azospirillum sp.]
MRNDNSPLDAAGLKPPVLMIGGIVTTAFTPWLSAAGNGARPLDVANSMERAGSRIDAVDADTRVNKDRS